MLSKIYADVTGTRQVERIDLRNFDSFAEFRDHCSAQSNACIVVVDHEQVDRVVEWLPAKHALCLTTDPDSLLERRLQRLQQPKPDSIDPLTKILTRRGFDEAIRALPAQFENDQSVSLVLCDLDHFKAFNDTHGHQAGDDAIVDAANLLQDACRASDIVARFGGEAFSILTTRDLQDVVAWVEELRRRIEFEFRGFELTASFGISRGSVGSMSEQVSTLYRQADEALYAAKAQGRNRCVQFEEMQNNTPDIGLMGLENRARVLSERVTSFIALHSKKIVDRVRAEADTDALTQFYTRRYFDRRFNAEVCETAGQMSIAFIDLDHFGNVNKEQGWPTGDKILREVCEIIRGRIRETDWVGRYGGEEFCIVMSQTQLREAVIVLERIRHAVEQQAFVSTSGEPVSMTLSIGAVELQSREEPLALLERASSQALLAKRNGRNQIAFELSS